MKNHSGKEKKKHHSKEVSSFRTPWQEGGEQRRSDPRFPERERNHGLKKRRESPKKEEMKKRKFLLARTLYPKKKDQHIKEKRDMSMQRKGVALQAGRGKAQKIPKFSIHPAG